MSRSVTMGTFRITVCLGGLTSVTGVTNDSPSLGLPSACSRIEMAGLFSAASRPTNGTSQSRISRSMGG